MDHDGKSSRTWQDIAKELSVEMDGNKVNDLAEELTQAMKKTEDDQQQKQQARRNAA